MFNTFFFKHRVVYVIKYKNMVQATDDNIIRRKKMSFACRLGKRQVQNRGNEPSVKCREFLEQLTF